LSTAASWGAGITVILPVPPRGGQRHGHAILDHA
jgi:hypothetical protein